MKRAIAALWMLTCLAPPAASQSMPKPHAPLDLSSDFYREPERAARPFSLMLVARNRSDIGNDARDAVIGMTLPMAGGSFSAGYVQDRDLFQSDGRRTKVAFGYYHVLSKDTTFYMVGSRLRSGVTVRYQTPLPGKTRQLISIGIRHQF